MVVTSSPVGEGEAQRLAALMALDLLDTPATEQFDRVARLAARVLAAPIALVSLVDRDRQWFKSCIGLPIRETDRSVSFCAHAVAAGEVLVVTDAALDPRFAENPLVTGEPHIRFYAGHPIHAPGGQPVGTLCVIDRSPRHIDDDQLALLADLAALVDAELANHAQVNDLDAVRRQLEVTGLELHRTQEQYARIVDNAAEGVLLVDRDDSVVFANAHMASMLGYGIDDLVGEPVERFIAPVARARTRRVFDRRRQGDTDELQAESVYLHRDGSEVPVRVAVAVLTDDDGAYDGSLAWVTDLTEVRRLEADLVAQQRRYELIVENSSDIIAVIDSTGDLRFASPAAGRILGHPHGYREPGGILAQVHPDDRDSAAAAFTGLLSTPGLRSDPVVLRVRVADGTYRHLECIGINRTDDATLNGLVLTARDVTLRVQLAEIVEHQALHDPLTDLANRRAFVEAVDRALHRADREGRTIACAYLDLDRFKAVNDQYGHATGDALLTEVADRLRATVRRGDLPARLGGDEFAVLFEPVEGADAAMHLAQRVLAALCSPVTIQGHTLDVPPSIGLTTGQPHDDAATMLDRADAALYRAKRAGGRRIDVLL